MLKIDKFWSDDKGVFRLLQALPQNGPVLCIAAFHCCMPTSYNVTLVSPDLSSQIWKTANIGRFFILLTRKKLASFCLSLAKLFVVTSFLL